VIGILSDSHGDLDAFDRAYRDLADPGPYKTDGRSIGRRALRNVCLAYLAAGDATAGARLAKSRNRDAPTGRADRSIGGRSRNAAWRLVGLLVVVELQGRLRLERDEEGKGKAARRGLCKGEDGTPIVQVALQRHDVTGEVVRPKIVRRLPLRSPFWRDVETGRCLQGGL